MSMAQLPCIKCGRIFDSTLGRCSHCGHPIPTTEEDFAEAPAPSLAEPAAAAARPVSPPKRSVSALSSASGKSGRGYGWISFMRVMLWILFGTIAFAALAGAVILSLMDSRMLLLSIAGFVLLIFLDFLLIAGGMIKLNNAENFARTADNTAMFLDRLDP